MQTNDKTDRYMKDRLAGYEQYPPDSNWDIIAQKMSKKKKKALGILFFRIAAGMAVIISIGIGYYFVNQSEYTPAVPVTVASELQIPGNTAIQKPGTPFSSGTQNQPSPSATEDDSDFSLAINNPAFSVQPENADRPYHSPEIQAPVNLPDVFTDLEMTYMAPLSKSDILQKFPDIKIAETNKESISQDEAIALIMSEYNEPLNEIAENKERQKWELGGEIAPLYSDRSIRSNSLESSVMNNLNQNESGIMAYAGGIRIAFSPVKRISVQSGIYYSRYGQTKNEAMMYNNLATTLEKRDIASITNSTGVISVNGSDAGMVRENESNSIMAHSMYTSAATEEVTIKQTFDYFEIPLVIKYKIIDRKMDFSFSGGVITNFLVGNKVNMIENGTRSLIGETTDINEINYVGSVGLGIEYPLVPRIALTLEPRFRYYINTIDQSSEISVHPYSFGFFAGVNYRF